MQPRKTAIRIAQKVDSHRPGSGRVKQEVDAGLHPVSDIQEKMDTLQHHDKKALQLSRTHRFYRVKLGMLVADPMEGMHAIWFDHMLCYNML